MGDATSQLPADLQAELRALEQGGAALSHYQVLGIGADADAATIRRAYLERSRRFHPDAHYRRGAGDLTAALARAFQRVAAAYQVLSDQEARAQYDQEHPHAFTSREREAVAQRAAQRQDDERRQSERRERLLRSKGFARIGAARKLYDEGLEYAAQGERGLAINALQTAHALDPERKEIELKLVELRRAAAQGRIASALQAGASRLAAADFAQALTWAQRAAEQDPNDARVRLLSARAYLGLGQKARAKAELRAALEAEPGNAEARELFRSI